MAMAPWRNTMPVMATRAFAAAPKPKIEDPTLQGRYATALFTASYSNLDKTMEDLNTLKGFMTDSSEFQLFLGTPGISQAEKLTVLEGLAKQLKLESTTLNF